MLEVDLLTVNKSRHQECLPPPAEPSAGVIYTNCSAYEKFAKDEIAAYHQSMTFGQLLKEARGNTGQHDLIQKIKEAAQPKTITLSLSTWSRWENDLFLPNFTDARLPHVAEVLRVDLDELLRALKRSAESTSPPFQAKRSDEFFAEAQSLITSMGTRNVDVYLLGPETLPILDDEGVRDIWAKNAANGVQYHILWLYEYVNPASVVRLGQTLADIDVRITRELSIAEQPLKLTKRLKGGRSLKISNYLVKLRLRDEPTAPGMQRALRRTQTEANFKILHSTDFAHVVFNDPRELSPIVLHRMMLHFDAHRTIGLYVDRQGKLDPQASLCLRDIRRDLKQAPLAEPVFFWLSGNRAKEMRDVLTEFRVTYEEQHSAKPPRAKAWQSA
jgi:transcriptional regulator with XRE-family HTH domain